MGCLGRRSNDSGGVTGLARAFFSAASRPSCLNNQGVATVLKENAEEARKCLLEDKRWVMCFFIALSRGSWSPHHAKTTALDKSESIE